MMLSLPHKSALLTLSAAAFIVMLANSILTLALPSLGGDLKASAAQLNWMVEAYPLFFAGLLLTFGSLADRFGRKRVLLFGLLLFTAASIITAFTDSSETVITLRAVSGIGGAMIMPSTLSIINAIYIKEARIKAIAVWSAVSGVGTLAGSLIGGAIITYGSWREAFLFQAILGIIVLGAALFVLQESKNSTSKSLDFWGYALSFAGIALVILSIMNFSSQGFGLSSIEFIAGLSILVIWFFVEKHSAYPSLNVRLFKSRTFCVGSVTLALAFFAVNSLLFLLSQLFQSAYGLTALSAALLTIAIVVPLIVVSPLSAMLIKRYGERITLLVGILLMFTGFVLSTFWESKTSIWVIAVCLVVLLSGMVLIMNPSTNMLLDSVPESDSGMASAMNDLTRELGGALGIAVLGSLVSALFTHKVQSSESFSNLLTSSAPQLHNSIVSAWIESFTAVMWVGAGLSFGILCFVFFFLKENQKNVR
jgi:EmrB/QacA subfamily drug resistance transporter